MTDPTFNEAVRELDALVFEPLRQRMLRLATAILVWILRWL